jgi:hypothetical protein
MNFYSYIAEDYPQKASFIIANSWNWNKFRTESMIPCRIGVNSEQNQ